MRICVLARVLHCQGRGVSELGHLGPDPRVLPPNCYYRGTAAKAGLDNPQNLALIQNVKEGCWDTRL